LALSAGELADRQQIVEVIDRYGTALDSKNYERFKTCFSEDARVYYGANEFDREAAAKFCEATLSPYAFTQHLLGNYEVQIDGDLASARTYLHATHVTPPEQGEVFVVGGTYIDELARQDGEWRITMRTLEAEWSERRKIAA